MPIRSRLQARPIPDPDEAMEPDAWSSLISEDSRLNQHPAKVITFNILDEIFDEQVPLQCSKFGDINYLCFVLFSRAIVTIPMIKNRCSHLFEGG
ncbi:hypothetical protein C4D60_Mb01t21270 [Musa balbisiana]|uniref:Uncharacterized protein n=1 Tax=Musa balbisiana TaxID=52838 RepID=A0A4S8JP21_MUSBA|nr:hypothetical protein C4D60_Mb01t21270 [Musa balbisiana]